MGDFAKRSSRVAALGFMQVVALLGVVGLAVLLDAILVSEAKTKGWVAGLVVGVVSVALTMLVLFGGRHARKR